MAWIGEICRSHAQHDRSFVLISRPFARTYLQDPEQKRFELSNSRLELDAAFARDAVVPPALALHRLPSLLSQPDFSIWWSSE